MEDWLAMMNDVEVDLLEAGEGRFVVLIHSSIAGTCRWRKLTEILACPHHVKTVNLFGCGRAASLPESDRQTLADDIALVGQAFSGSVAMQFEYSGRQRADDTIFFNATSNLRRPVRPGHIRRRNAARQETAKPQG